MKKIKIVANIVFLLFAAITTFLVMYGKVSKESLTTWTYGLVFVIIVSWTINVLDLLRERKDLGEDDRRANTFSIVSAVIVAALAVCSVLFLLHWRVPFINFDI